MLGCMILDLASVHHRAWARIKTLKAGRQCVWMRQGSGMGEFRADRSRHAALCDTLMSMCSCNLNLRLTLYNFKYPDGSQSSVSARPSIAHHQLFNTRQCGRIGVLPTIVRDVGWC